MWKAIRLFPAKIQDSCGSCPDSYCTVDSIYSGDEKYISYSTSATGLHVEIEKTDNHFQYTTIHYYLYDTKTDEKLFGIDLTNDFMCYTDQREWVAASTELGVYLQCYTMEPVNCNFNYYVRIIFWLFGLAMSICFELQSSEMDRRIQ